MNIKRTFQAFDLSLQSDYMSVDWKNLRKKPNILENASSKFWLFGLSFLLPTFNKMNDTFNNMWWPEIQ